MRSPDVGTILRPVRAKRLSRPQGGPRAGLRRRSASGIVRAWPVRLARLAAACDNSIACPMFPARLPGMFARRRLAFVRALVSPATFVGLVVAAITAAGRIEGAEAVDFNRDIRPILSDNCFKCHGPDSKGSEGGRKPLRLDSREHATAELRDGHHAIVPQHPERSELIRRITASSPDDRMPPPETGKTLSARDRSLLQAWIQQGADYARHWAYVIPTRPSLPRVKEKRWARNPIDSFILARLEAERLKHAPEADPSALIRRVSLDLTGLPPSVEEVDRFLNDRGPDAYERLVDRLLAKEAYGEHWARLWLDLARYADSTGYADDPPRTIWAFRDWVIRAFNANVPFDRFTVEQLAGDLLENPTDDQLVATAFHRNTMTNNEGGTNDEEYRNVAIVDRVNTTMAVWMGTTMACAQCHNHKYDPVTQEEYFRLYAVLNNTADADRGDESPVLPLYTEEQKRQRAEWQSEIARLEKVLQTSTPALASAQAEWEKTFTRDLAWDIAVPIAVKSKAGALVAKETSGVVRFARGGKTDIYTLEIPVPPGETVAALRLETLPDETLPQKTVGHADGNFVLSRVVATVAPSDNVPVRGRYVRIELPGKEKMLSLAEVLVFHGASNVALRGEARQSSTAFDGPARFAVDGNTDGRFDQARSTTHTGSSTDPWWEVDLRGIESVDRIVVWNRTESAERLKGYRVQLLDEKRGVVWEQAGQPAPAPSSEFRPDGARNLELASAQADFAQKDFGAASILGNTDPANRGWAIAPHHTNAHALTLTLTTPSVVGPGSNLVVTLEQLSKYEYATIARLRLARTSDRRAAEFARVPAALLAVLRTGAERRTEAQRNELAAFYRSIAPALQSDRDGLAMVRKKLDESKPYTTTPIYRELASDKRRTTRLQRRGNFLDVGAEMSGGLPATLHPAPAPARGSVDRLALARWLMDTNNPLTARVTVNRLWESIFGTGLVRTTEEFGAQGEPPSHPDLLDWLAVELTDRQWDFKHMLRLMVTSAAYRQSSRVTPDLAARDPDNRLMARGPRFRLTAEMVRDQALTVSGLLSAKMYGPPVKPPQPKLGLSAAFGSATDWETSAGEDGHRRAIYTTWRRSNPYPSMATFDAPNREVCLLRRERSNTPLQALVTLNDPVYLEAAQALARRMVAASPTPAGRVQHGFKRCLSRAPSAAEQNDLIALFERTLPRFRGDLAKAREFATKPIGEPPAGVDVAELAAWTVVGNVLLNLDEVLMKR